MGVEVDGEVGVTITLGGPDEDLWRIEDGPGLYMYKLIVARRYAGRRLGALITNWVCDKAARCGYPGSRLDAWPPSGAPRRGTHAFKLRQFTYGNSRDARPCWSRVNRDTARTRVNGHE